MDPMGSKYNPSPTKGPDAFALQNAEARVKATLKGHGGKGGLRRRRLAENLRVFPDFAIKNTAEISEKICQNVAGAKWW